MLRRLTSLALAGALSLALINTATASQGSGCMPTTGTVSGLSFAQLVNQAFAALISGNSGASAPATDCTATPVKGQVWLDTSVTPNVERRYDGNSWVAVGAIDATNHVWSPPVGGGTAAISAASTTDICAAPSAVQSITGTTPITSFGTACVVGARKTLIFNSATPLTYNATSLILPGQRDYTTAAGDMADAIYLGSGNWRVKDISKIDGSSVTNPAIPLATAIFGRWGTIPVKTVYGMGQALSRAAYPDYFAANTRVMTATLTAGNNALVSVPNVDGLGAGMPIEGVGIQAGTTIASIVGTSNIVMSNTATANGAQTIRIFIDGYGAGGDSTTVGVQDCRGRVMAGRDNPLGSAAGTINSTYFGMAATSMRAFGGSGFAALSTAHLPPHTHSGTTGAMNSNATHSHSIPDQPYSIGGGGNSPWQDWGQSGGNGVAAFPGTNPANIDHTHNFTTGNGPGTSTPFSTFQPTNISECVVVVLP